MVLVLIARTVLLFLMAWEVMSLAAYFLVTFEHDKPEARRAGWTYLIAAHLGAAFLILALLILGWHAGRLEFDGIGDTAALGAGWAGLVFLLAVVGFGTKAGFVPFHVWLPEAHAAAPSHVSALMSGVMIKMGLYGLLRILTLLGPPAAWWGPTLALLGLFTALVAITLALQQRDIKRVLAYSSIENMGLIGLALGIGLTARSQGQPEIAALGMTAALLHTANHTLMKGLMFLAAGSVLHGAGTRDMEQLGGLLRRMPWTGATMVVGAVALAALPPLNGFTSKWLMYLGLIRAGFAQTGGVSLVTLLAIGLLAVIGGLSAVTFLRLIGIVLLGNPRSDNILEAHESSPWLLGPMVVLAILCVGVAIVPYVVIEPLLGVADTVFGWDAGAARRHLDLEQTPLDIIGTVNAWVLALMAAGGILMAVWLRKQSPAEGATWGCGYARPTAKMQYTGRSFAEMMAEHLLPRFLRPRTHRAPPQGVFPGASEFAAETPDPVTEGVYQPFFRRWARRFSALRILQQGRIHIYLIYIFMVVVLALAWLTVRIKVRAWWGVS
jgi:formate hydrogenlyase subunit 3/multisubunit Na+/H+ antiporter MnhD subunit